MHVAIVDEELPYPPTSGKRIRTLNLTVRLARRHRVTFLCHGNADPAEVRDGRAYLAERSVATVVVDRPPPPKSVLSRDPRFYAKLAANLFSPRPYVVDANVSAVLRQAVADFAGPGQVDLWQCEWTPYAEYLRRLPGARWLVMAHNIESLIWQRYYETEGQPLKRWYIKHQWHKFERYERSVFAEATRTVTVTDEDARLARDRFGADRVSVVDNGVDTEYFTPSPAPRDRHQVLFLGSLDWRPNLDAVSMLLDEIFPAVVRDEPSARLSVVGRNPPAWLGEKVKQLPWAELHANVSDVRPFLAQGGALAVPLRIGGGSRLKILEALASGVPVISSAVGAEGLHLVGGEDLVIADGPALSRALVEHIRNPEPGLALARSGRQKVLRSYDWEALSQKLELVWESCLSTGRASLR